MPVYELPDDSHAFPDPNKAEEGLLAYGGDLHPRRILAAYHNGIFPWFSEDDPLLWWSPDPRWVITPQSLKVSKSMKKVLRDQTFTITFNKCFEEVIHNCQAINRKGQDGSWITQDIIDSYTTLHRMGYAHSVEAWQGDQLVGGLYGIQLFDCFFGESMFATVSNASKAAFITMVQTLSEQGLELIDCQIHTSHLESLGAFDISRQEFLAHLKTNKEMKLNIDWSKL